MPLPEHLIDLYELSIDYREATESERLAVADRQDRAKTFAEELRRQEGQTVMLRARANRMRIFSKNMGEWQYGNVNGLNQGRGLLGLEENQYVICSVDEAASNVFVAYPGKQCAVEYRVSFDELEILPFNTLGD